MWNVDQVSSRGLLGNFYSQLAGAGNLSSKWRALRAAQVAYIGSRDENLSHPYHWGPFVLIGDWR
jgi:CHAT domain-containing protein